MEGFQTAAGKDVILRGVTTLCAGSNELLAEAKANTRLIVAAPTMYDFIEQRAAQGDQEAIQILGGIHANS